MSSWPGGAELTQVKGGGTNLHPQDSITKRDILILISNSGNSEELKNIIQYANRNRIKLIGIVSKKNSLLYKASDVKLLIPEVQEAGF